MATLKRCDACHEIWNPDDHYDAYNQVDTNLSTVSVHIPRNNDRIDYSARAGHSKSYEVCYECAREVVRLLEGRAPSTS